MAMDLCISRCMHIKAILLYKLYPAVEKLSVEFKMKELLHVSNRDLINVCLIHFCGYYYFFELLFLGTEELTK